MSSCNYSKEDLFLPQCTNQSAHHLASLQACFTSETYSLKQEIMTRCGHETLSSSSQHTLTLHTLSKIESMASFTTRMMRHHGTTALPSWVLHKLQDLTLLRARERVTEEHIKTILRRLVRNGRLDAVSRGDVFYKARFM